MDAVDRFGNGPLLGPQNNGHRSLKVVKKAYCSAKRRASPHVVPFALTRASPLQAENPKPLNHFKRQRVVFPGAYNGLVARLVAIHGFKGTVVGLRARCLGISGCGGGK